MLYLGIDQHRKQLTVNLRDEAGATLLRRQVSTQWNRVRAFLGEVQAAAQPHGGFMAMVEICGFNDWLVKLLPEYGCREIVLVQPSGRACRKTDRRDANLLSEQLWINRHRLLSGQQVHGLRRVTFPNHRDAQDRQLTALRQRLVQWRTKTINKVQHLLLKHNLQQECPTQGIKSKRARQWLAELSMHEIDRLELNLLLAQWAVWDEQLGAIEKRITQRQQAHPLAAIVATMPGAGASGSLGVAHGADRSFPDSRQLSQLLGFNSRLPQLERGDQPAWLDYQARQQPGPISTEPDGHARAAPGSLDEALVSAREEPPRSEDRSRGGHASTGHDPLAHGPAPTAVRCRWIVYRYPSGSRRNEKEWILTQPEEHDGLHRLVLCEQSIKPSPHGPV